MHVRSRARASVFLADTGRRRRRRPQTFRCSASVSASAALSDAGDAGPSSVRERTRLSGDALNYYKKATNNALKFGLTTFRWASVTGVIGELPSGQCQNVSKTTIRTNRL